MSQTDERAYFKIPFDDKDDAKALGARFDGTRKQWYAPDEAVKEALASRWTAAGGGTGGQPSQQQAKPWSPPGQDRYASQQGGSQEEARVLFEVPFDDNQIAKGMGARFDKPARKWCAHASEALLAANRLLQIHASPGCGAEPRACSRCSKVKCCMLDGQTFAPDAQVAALMDAQWPRVGGGAGGRDRDRSGMPGKAAAPPASSYSAYGRGPGEENTWHQGPRSHPANSVQQPADGSKVYFAVSFDEKDEAKALGARFDGSCKCWYGGDPVAIYALETRFERK